MRIDRDLLGWGVFFLVAGGVPLAIQGGVLPAGVVDRWWSWWPLILVGIGVGLVLRRTPVELLGGVLVSGTLGVMVAGALGGGIGGFAGLPSGVCGPDDGGVPFQPRTGTFESAARVSVELDCGEVDISTIDGGDWALDGTDDDGVGPDVSAGPADLDLRTRRDGAVDLLGERDRWRLRLPTEHRLDLELGLDAGRMTVDLAGAEVGVIELQTNAGQARLDLADVEAIDGFEIAVNAGEVDVELPSVSMTGAIEINAGNVRLCAPDAVALRLHTGDSVLASQDFAEAGLEQVGDGVWETPGYDVAVTRIELRTEANAGAFHLDPPDGCG